MGLDSVEMEIDVCPYVLIEQQQIQEYAQEMEIARHQIIVFVDLDMLV